MHLRAIVLSIALSLAACAATRSGPTKAQEGYLKAHPLSPDEERRLYAREAKRGDSIDRVRVTFDGCDFERTSVEGELAVWRVHIPIDQRPIRIDTDKLVEIAPGSDVLLTFRRDALESAF
jgi:hypothetical protein